MISLLTHYVIYRIGRRLSFFTCLATLITGGFLTSISNSFWTWAATRVVVGLTIPAIYQIPFIICKILFVQMRIKNEINIQRRRIFSRFTERERMLICLLISRKQLWNWLAQIIDHS